MNFVKIVEVEMCVLSRAIKINFVRVFKNFRKVSIDSERKKKVH